MKTVYYETMRDEDMPALELMCTTSKAYWDRHHAVDDGGGPDYRAISDAMAACGAPETAESVFEIPAGTAPAVVDAMAAHGFSLVRSPAFKGLLSQGM